MLKQIEVPIDILAKLIIELDLKHSIFNADVIVDNYSFFNRDNMDMFVARVISKDLLWAELCDITGEEPHVILTTHMHTILLHLLPAIANSSPALRDNKRILEKCTNILSEQNILVSCFSFPDTMMMMTEFY